MGEEITKETNEILEIKYRDDIHVIQANELIRSKKDDLTLLETKLIRLAIAQILQHDKDLQTYSCKILELASFLGMPRQNAHREIEKFAKNIMRKTITIEEKSSQPKQKKTPNWKMFHWVDSCFYKDGIITFKLSEELKPYLIGLYGFFTQYSFAEILNLPTANSISLFELLASYRNLRFAKGQKFGRKYEGMKLKSNECLFTIEFLREYFNCENKYPQTGDFVNRVIEMSVNAINKNKEGQTKVSFVKVKDGRKIEAIIFKVNKIWEKNLE